MTRDQLDALFRNICRDVRYDMSTPTEAIASIYKALEAADIPITSLLDGSMIALPRGSYMRVNTEMSGVSAVFDGFPDDA